MQYAIVARGKFSAAHRLPDVEGHSENHGHVYSVEVTEETRFDKSTEGLAQDPEDLTHDLFELLEELNRRDLNVMLMGSPPTLAGIASQLLERLSMAHHVVRVAVREDEGAEVIVTRELRK